MKIYKMEIKSPQILKAFSNLEIVDGTKPFATFLAILTKDIQIVQNNPIYSSRVMFLWGKKELILKL